MTATLQEISGELVPLFTYFHPSVIQTFPVLHTGRFSLRARLHWKSLLFASNTSQTKIMYMDGTLNAFKPLSHILPEVYQKLQISEAVKRASAPFRPYRYNLFCFLCM